ncbi:MAG: sulfatase [Planctomycetes bacterium]|nr:sulfatase [Planctomycetota bacterium]
MRLRLVPFLLLAALPSCFLLDRRTDENVLMIVVDSLRFDAFSRSLGSAETPNVHKLIEEGMTYRSCYSQSSVTLPAHAAILSSRAPNSSGVRNDGQAVSADVPLLSQHLKERGWQTFANVSTAELAPPARDEGIDRGFDTFRTHSRTPAEASEVNERVNSFIENAQGGAPWFAYVEYSDPSRADELVGMKEIVAKVYLDGVLIGNVRTKSAEDWSVKIDATPGPHRLEFRSDDTFNLRRMEIVSDSVHFTPKFEHGRLFAPMQSISISFTNDHERPITCRLQAQIRGVQSLAECRARYKAQVEAVDRAIGEVIETLKKTNQYDRTVIVLTGSHGEALGEHGVTGHDTTLYDEVLRVPLIIKPVANDGRRVALAKRQFSIVRHIDVAPTILDMIGQRSMTGAEGVSILEDVQREVVAESHPPESVSPILAMRDDRYKLVFVAREDRFEMYDVKSDTLESENIFPLQGHFRSTWQINLRRLADAAPQTAKARPAFAPVVPTGEQATAPRSAQK